MCNNKATGQSQSGVTSYVSGTGISSIVPTEWKVVAHEIGHNFGAIHDCTSSQCPTSCNGKSCGCCPCGDGSTSGGCDCAGKYLMHPTDNALTDQFSPCSLNYMCQNLPALGTCLKDPGTIQQISSGICGNGIKEGKQFFHNF